MSVLIKGMRMPKEGCKDCVMVQRGKVFDTCPFLKQEVNGNVERGGKPNGCPLIDVPDTNVGDLISRQAAINAIENTDCELSTDDWDELTDALMQLPSAQRWIPVSERLPEDETKVLVTVFFHGVKDYSGGWNAHIKPSFYVDIAEHYDDEWHSDSDEYKIARNRHEVITWMPLPKPYKEEKNDAEAH